MLGWGKMALTLVPGSQRAETWDQKEKRLIQKKKVTRSAAVLVGCLDSSGSPE